MGVHLFLLPVRFHVNNLAAFLMAAVEVAEVSMAEAAVVGMGVEVEAGGTEDSPR